ncbi:CsbD family protein [Streptomyces sp. NPDC127097]|uniref:CsbD family protein n=1 Tax=Streptomyces sp. NPDC127097 TaxID=3347136 RepID=UPI003652F10C
MADKGAMDKMKGKAKQKAGKIMGDERLKGEGRADEAKGRAKGAMSDAKENARGVKDSMKGRSRS